MNGKDKCKNCEEVKIAELSERVAKLEKEVSKQPLDYKALIIGGLTGLAIGLILGLMVNKRK